jgi:putative transcriptional regulator
MPTMGDPRFARSVIYVCAHSADGAMGIVINKVAPTIDFVELLVQLEVISKTRADTLDPQARRLRVHHGGPVETGRGFVLHSADYHRENATLTIDESVSLTATLDVLRAIAEGTGPEHAFLALGYAGWAAGQLEAEIQANGWLTSRADPDILFGEDLDAKYERTLAKIGVHPGMLASDAGHA